MADEVLRSIIVRSYPGRTSRLHRRDGDIPQAWPQIWRAGWLFPSHLYHERHWWSCQLAVHRAFHFTMRVVHPCIWTLMQAFISDINNNRLVLGYANRGRVVRRRKMYVGIEHRLGTASREHPQVGDKALPTPSVKAAVQSFTSNIFFYYIRSYICQLTMFGIVAEYVAC